MDLHAIKTISCTTSKLMVRTGLFRLLFGVIYASVLVFALYYQSDLFTNELLAQATLSSFIPYMNVFLFTLLLVLPVVFFAAGVLAKNVKYPTHEVIYARPESNVEYLLGTFWGILRVVLGTGIVSLAIAAVVHLFISSSPFHILPYLFYFFTLLLPSFVFVTGLSLLVSSLIQQRGVALLVLLGLLFGFCYLPGYDGISVIDPFGIGLPAAFSDVTGFPEAGSYLLQRLGWLLLGGAFLGFSISRFHRLPNAPHGRKGVNGIATLVLLLGVCCCALQPISRYQEKHARERYSAAYTKYNDTGKLTLLKQEIEYGQQGNTLHVKSRMVVQNQTGKPLRQPVFYLNPSLNISALRVEGVEASFKREHQVILFSKEVTTGDSLTIEMEYAGKVDDRVMYLDVPDELTNDRAGNRYLNCRFGKKHLFLSSQFTLLIPECLWYPVTRPPVNPLMTYDIQREFTEYSLKVTTPAGMTAISQGHRSGQEGVVSFRNDQPLSGLSLCIGPYTRYTLPGEGRDFELYLFKGHESLLRGLELLRDTIPGLLEGIIGDLETTYGKEYPFRFLKGIETPVSFAAYYRNERGTSEFVQPEMLFLPERAVTLHSGNFSGLQTWIKREPERFRQGMRKEVSDLEMDIDLFRMFITRNFILEQVPQPTNPAEVKVRYLNPLRLADQEINSYHVSALFFHYSGYIHSPEYPVMDILFHSLLQQEKVGDLRQEFAKVLPQEAVDYLNGNNLKNALHDKHVPPRLMHEVVKLKSNDLKYWFTPHGVPGDSLMKFMFDYTREHHFRVVDFGGFNDKFKSRFGVDWFDVLPAWYTTSQLPAFIVKDYLFRNVEVGQPGKLYRVEFKVYNDSDVNGVVSLVTEEMVRPRVIELVTRSYVIPPREGRHIVFTRDDIPMMSGMNTNISRNLPRMWGLMRPGESVISHDTSQGITPVDPAYFLPPPRETIVDNSDEGFQAYNERSVRFFSPSKFQKESTVSSDYNRMFRDIWSACMSVSAYGIHYFTCTGKRAGTGNARVEWKTGLTKPGEYELFAYVTNLPKNVAPWLSESYAERHGIRGGNLPPPPFYQHYTVVYGKEAVEVIIDLATVAGYEGEWMSLGRYSLPEGECRVILSDLGDPAHQIIYADAVKWVSLSRQQKLVD